MPKVVALEDYRKRRGGALSRPSPAHWFIAYWRFWHESLDRMTDHINALERAADVSR
jgi:hypothetical protein